MQVLTFNEETLTEKMEQTSYVSTLRILSIIHAFLSIRFVDVSP